VSGADAALAGALRNWAEGTLWARAAVELLTAGVGGRLCYAGAPWVKELGAGADGRDYARIDPEALVRCSGPLSSGERLIAKLVANLVDDQTLAPLADLARLDDREAKIALGALRLAAGLPRRPPPPARAWRLPAPKRPPRAWDRPTRPGRCHSRRPPRARRGWRWDGDSGGPPPRGVFLAGGR
jgi:hypothetical protein